jgi:hypothetical protein
MFGIGLCTINDCAFDVPPPGAGLVIVILNAPAVVKSDIKIAAVNCVAETYVVVLAEPAKFTTDVAIKFVPLTVRVNPASPIFFEVGEIEVVVGIGFGAVDVPVAHIFVVYAALSPT